MKKAVIITILLLAMLCSLAAGTLALYTTTLSDIASGGVISKEFTFLKDGQDDFSHNVKIAPSETVTWHFAVKNYVNSIVTQTDLYYVLTFDIDAASGKTAISPLTVNVKNEDGELLESLTGTGQIKVSGYYPVSTSGQRTAYTVEITWPSNDTVDINYAGKAFGTAVNVSALASQAPIDAEQDQDETADMSLSLTSPAPDDNNTIGVGGEVKTGAVNVENGTTSVLITGTKLESQTVTIGGADAADVTADNTSQTAPVYTVDTSSLAPSGGSMEFTLTVTETNKTDIVYQVTVTVAAPGIVAVESVSLDHATLVLSYPPNGGPNGVPKTLTATVLPFNATDKAVTWSSSNEAAATVDQNGTVTFVNPGTAVITATTVDGGKTATCNVTTQW